VSAYNNVERSSTHTCDPIYVRVTEVGHLAVVTNGVHDKRQTLVHELSKNSVSVNLNPPGKPDYAHHPTLIHFEQGSRYFDLFDKFRSAPSLKLCDVDEDVFIFLDATEVHVFSGVWQELWMGVIPE